MYVSIMLVVVMSTDEINKKIKKWKIIYWLNIISFICILIFFIYKMITGTCYFYVCTYGLEALINLMFMAIISAFPMVFIILNIILLITSKIRIYEYSKLNKLLKENNNDIEEVYNKYINEEEIKTKLNIWKLIFIVTLIPIIILGVYALIRTFEYRSFINKLYTFYYAIVTILLISTILIIPLIYVILDIVFFILAIIKIIKYKKMLNIDFKS